MVVQRCRSRGFLALPASPDLRLACSPTGRARLRPPHYRSAASRDKKFKSTDLPETENSIPYGVLFFCLELMSRFELPTLPTVRHGRSSSHLKVLPSASCLTGLPPRCIRHRRRSAQPPLPRLLLREISRSISLMQTKKKNHPIYGVIFLFWS